MKILHFNVNGFRSILKKNYIINNKSFDDNTFVNFIRKRNPDIICLNETKMNCKVNELFNTILPEYCFKYWSHCVSNTSRHGVAVFSKIKPINVTYSPSKDNTNIFDGRFIQLEFNSFYLIAVYVPNSGRMLESLDKRTKSWDNIIFKYMNKLKIKKDIIYTGDLNVVHLEQDTYDFKHHRNKLAGVTDIERFNFQSLLNSGFINVYRSLYPKKIIYTFFSHLFKSRIHNKGLFLDYFIITPALLKRVKKMKILSNIYGSDHVPIELTIQ